MIGIQQLKGYSDSDFGMGLFTFYREQAEIDDMSHKKQQRPELSRYTEVTEQSGNRDRVTKIKSRFESIFLSNREKSRLNKELAQKISLINLKKQIIAPFEKIKKKRSKQLRIYNRDDASDIFESRKKLFKRKFKTDQSFGLNQQVKLQGYSYPSNKLLQFQVLSPEIKENSLPKIKKLQQSMQYQINKNNERGKLSPINQQKEKERKRRFLTQENSRSIQNIKRISQPTKEEKVTERQQNKREKSFSNFVMISEKHYQLLAKSGLRKEIPLISIFKKYSKSN